MKDNNVKKFVIVVLMLLVVLVCGTTYALFTKTLNPEKVISMTTGTRYIGIYGENKENLGLNVTYTFTIENRGVEDASYQITVEDIVNTIGRENINYQYTKGEESKNGKLSDGVVDEANLAPGESVTVTITLTSSMSGDYKGKIKVTTDEPIPEIDPCIADLGSDKEDTSGANPPELRGDMIPVVYNTCTSSWVKADTESSWYNYDEQVWANAVTIGDATKRAQYVAANAGTEILMADINTMMVWIPRYSYTLGNTYGYKIDGASEPSMATPGAFDIKFVDNNTIELGSGQYTGSSPENYFTPSSFCWGDTCDDEATRKDSENIELPGIWVAKFELGGNANTISSKPSQYSLKIRLSYLFNNIQSQINGENGSTNYGLSGNYDGHMMKNTEWGAFAYLSQSKYGKYGNSKYEGANKEVYVNNYFSNYNYLTGCSGGSPKISYSTTCKYQYNSGLEGTGASTTGTIYGIYDTSGGAWDYVMGNGNKILDKNNTYFDSLPSLHRYYNLYTTYTGIKGDATNADGTKGFYGDYQGFVAMVQGTGSTNAWTWFGRGSDSQVTNSGSAGIFSSNGLTGGTTTSRFVISPW